MAEYNINSLTSDIEVKPTVQQGMNRGVMARPQGINSDTTTESSDFGIESLKKIVSAIKDRYEGDSTDLEDTPVRGRDVADGVYSEFDKLIDLREESLRSAEEVKLMQMEQDIKQSRKKPYGVIENDTEEETPNVKSLPEQDSITATELDGAAVGGASDGKVDEGLMSRPYDKEAMLDINEPKSVGETFEGIFKFIEKGEGGYEASNRGTQNKKIVGSDLSTIRDGKKLTEMTLGEIKNLQSITSPSNTNRLFAVGRFQMIPDVLKEAQEAVGLPDDTIFDEKTQNTLGRYLVTDKREKLKDYLAGNRNISTETAMLELAKEFASFPVPKDITIRRGGKDVTIKKGNTYYGDGANKASHKVANVKAMLIAARGGIPIKSGVVDESLRPKARPTKLASN